MFSKTREGKREQCLNFTNTTFDTEINAEQIKEVMGEMLIETFKGQTNVE